MSARSARSAAKVKKELCSALCSALHIGYWLGWTCSTTVDWQPRCKAQRLRRPNTSPASTPLHQPKARASWNCPVVSTFTRLVFPAFCSPISDSSISFVKKRLQSRRREQGRSRVAAGGRQRRQRVAAAGGAASKQAAALQILQPQEAPTTRAGAPCGQQGQTPGGSRENPPAQPVQEALPPCRQHVAALAVPRSVRGALQSVLASSRPASEV